MRSLAVALLVAGGSALAQDAATQASMAAMQASQQASEQAIQASQQASQAAMLATQQASQAATDASLQASQAAASGNEGCLAPKPQFSIKPGAYGGAQTVYLSDKGRHAAIYYTTNGWTPTDQSVRYAGPVAVNATTRLKAVAFVPGCGRSQVAEAVYTLPGKPVETPVVVGADGMLRKGTSLPLLFVTPVNSATARIGDALELTSAGEMRVGSKLFAPGTLKATGAVTAVERPGIAGQPGEISFALRAMNVDGVAVPLSGVQTIEGADKLDKAKHRAFIPVVGFFSLLAIHGDNAEIAPGALVTGEVKADTVLPASLAQGR